MGAVLKASRGYILQNKTIRCIQDSRYIQRSKNCKKLIFYNFSLNRNVFKVILTNRIKSIHDYQVKRQTFSSNKPSNQFRQLMDVKEILTNGIC